MKYYEWLLFYITSPFSIFFLVISVLGSYLIPAYEWRVYLAFISWFTLTTITLASVLIVRIMKDTEK